MVLTIAVSGMILLEQPVGSDQVIVYHNRFSWFTEEVIYVLPSAKVD